jgi:hypothetical protein
MRHKTYLKLAISFLVVTILCWNARPLEAASIGFHVTINTSSLAGSSSAPFALDFQLNGGNPLGNTATISNFTFGGGSASSLPPATTFGLASGTLASTVTVSDNTLNTFNEFYQGFTPGFALGFDVLLTTNTNLPTPDLFSVAILDKNLSNITTGGLGDSLLMVNLDSSSPRVQTSTGIGAYSAVNAFVPEADSIVLLSIALFGLGTCVVWRRSSTL